MSKQFHTRSSFIIVAAAVMAVALPVTVLLSREDHAAAEAMERAQVGLAVPAYSIAPTAGTATIVSTGAEWTGDATQSATMVLVGTILIGLGSIVRKTA
jgi:hypothetical protein